MKSESVMSILILFAMGLNGLWYYIKYVLHQQGYETHLFWGHFKDIANLHSLHNREQDPQKKRTYRILLFSFYIGLLFFFGGAIMIFSR